MRRQNAPGMCDNTMKGSKNDYSTFTGAIRRLAHGSLVKQILVGLVLGILLAWIPKPAAEAVGLLGTLFVGALKAVAPILVLMLVMASIANHEHGAENQYPSYFVLYLLGTFSCSSGRSSLQLCLPFYPAIVQ